MDTHFEFTCLLFLSRMNFKYQQSSFKATKFDGRLTNPDLEKLLSDIYKATNDFSYLKGYHARKKGCNLSFWFVGLTVLALFLLVFSGFKPLFFLIFILIALMTLSYIVVTLLIDNYYFKKSLEYEGTVVGILSTWNEKYREKGIKFSIMRSFYVLMIHADYKKPGFKFNLVQGKIMFDKEGKLIDMKAKEKTKGRRMLSGVIGQGNRAIQDLDGGAMEENRASGNQTGASAQLVVPGMDQGIGAVQGQYNSEQNQQAIQNVNLQNAGGDRMRENNFEMSRTDKKEDFTNLTYVSIASTKIKI